MKKITCVKEADVKKQVKKLLDDAGWFWWMPPANGFGKVGVSDFNALRNGVFLAVETKFGRNKPTANQNAYLNSIMAEDGIAFVVDEQNIEWFEAWLAAFNRATIAQSHNQQVTPEDGATMVNAIKYLHEKIL